MNTLSWLLYLAEVVGRLGCFAFLVGLANLVVAGVCFAAGCVNYDGNAADRANGDWWWSKINKFVSFGVGFILLAILIPTTRTIYLIAGSEAAGVVVQSQEAKELLDAVQEKIKSYLKVDEDKPKEKTE